MPVKAATCLLLVACGSRTSLVVLSDTDAGEPSTDASSSPPDAPSKLPPTTVCPKRTLTPTAIFTRGGADLFGIVADDHFLYVEDEFANDAWVIPKCGGPATQLSPAHAGVAGNVLAATGTNFFWTYSFGNAQPFMTTIFGVAAGGHGANFTVTTATGLVGGLAADTTTLFYVAQGGLWSVVLPDGTPQSILQDPTVGGDPALDATDLFVVRFPPYPPGTGSPTIERMARSGGTVRALWTDPGPVQQSPSHTLALDADNVYWVAPSGSVVKVSKGDDGYSEVLATTAGPSDLAVDNASVYLADTGSLNEPATAAIKVVSKTGGAHQTARVFAPAHEPSGIVVDEQSVYWVEFPDRVVKVDK